ncbi:sulfotransferase [Aliiruegeria sabulilitoris]|uniref:sulfotransferase n=1 Tax=Aliiruegeria sabulilitoris TaxID=1510458 RepID=UPI00082CE3E6|nr:sulfotransferase [Aliiruegeria sabulilitoris]NDR58913.1 sulfotransferase [Pseudoruegeria sp. M32A2M]
MSVLAPLAVCLVVVLCFGIGLWKTAIASSAKSVLSSVQAGVSAMSDPDMDDAAKERAVQKAGLSLIGKTFGLTTRLLATFALAALPIFAADLAGLVPYAASMDMMLRWEFIIGVSIVAILVGGWISRSFGTTQTEASDEPYNAGDQLVHTLAFASPAVMRGLGRLDDRLFAKTISEVKLSHPVFITSLARGGTTAVLNALHGLPSVATHRYRDMPFLTAPLSWARAYGSRARAVARRERAHGDGMEIDLDSPEAFDEILWGLYWPEKYGARRISLWQESDQQPRAEDAFDRHFAKIGHLRRPETASSGKVHYLSKNNANIARLSLLPAMFPGCRIVVPLRSPGAHAASLLRQHRNFLERHATDAFTRRYMRDIGHLEFGALLKPIAFDGFDPTARDATEPDFWLSYWIAAFNEIARKRDACLCVTQDDLRTQPQATMQALCEASGIPDNGADFTGHFRAGADSFNASAFSPGLLKEAEEIYAELSKGAVRG